MCGHGSSADFNHGVQALRDRLADLAAWLSSSATACAIAHIWFVPLVLAVMIGRMLQKSHPGTK